MSMPTSLRAYADCQELWEKAKADPKGARACLGTQDAALVMRQRMHQMRSLDRKANAETYIEDHPMHGVSVYDELQISLKMDETNEWWLYIEPRTAKILQVDGLSELDEEAAE